MLITQALIEKQMNADQRKAFAHADSAFDPYKSYERTEMSLDAMLNMQYLTFQSYQEIVQFMHPGLMDYLQFADFQNQTVIQISRCLVSAASCGEELNSYYQAEGLINEMLGEMSYHARRIFDQGCVQQYGLKFFQSANTLLAEILTTIRRLKATRKKIRDGSIQVVYHPEKSAESFKKSPASKPADSAYHAETAFTAQHSAPVQPVPPAAGQPEPVENQPQEAPAPAFQPDPALSDEEEEADIRLSSTVRPEFLLALASFGFQPFDEPAPDDFFLAPFAESALPSRASP